MYIVDKKFIYILGQIFLVTRRSPFSSVGKQFISINSLAPSCCLELNFKQKKFIYFQQHEISFSSADLTQQLE